MQRPAVEEKVDERARGLCRAAVTGSDHVDLALVVFPDEREGEKLLCRARGKTGDDGAAEPARHGAQHGLAVVDARDDVERAGVDAVFGEEFLPEIGRASCRERV